METHQSELKSHLLSCLSCLFSAAPAPLSDRVGSVQGAAPALPLCHGHAQSFPPLPHPAGVRSRRCRHAVQLRSGGLQPPITGWDSHSTVKTWILFLFPPLFLLALGVQIQQEAQEAEHFLTSPWCLSFSLVRYSIISKLFGKVMKKESVFVVGIKLWTQRLQCCGLSQYSRNIFHFHHTSTKFDTINALELSSVATW